MEELQRAHTADGWALVQGFRTDGRLDAMSLAKPMDGWWEKGGGGRRQGMRWRGSWSAQRPSQTSPSRRRWAEREWLSVGVSVRLRVRLGKGTRARGDRGAGCACDRRGRTCSRATGLGRGVLSLSVDRSRDGLTAWSVVEVEENCGGGRIERRVHGLSGGSGETGWRITGRQGVWETPTHDASRHFGAPPVFFKEHPWP